MVRVLSILLVGLVVGAGRARAQDSSATSGIQAALDAVVSTMQRQSTVEWTVTMEPGAGSVSYAMTRSSFTTDPAGCSIGFQVTAKETFRDKKNKLQPYSNTGFASITIRIRGRWADRYVVEEKSDENYSYRGGAVAIRLLVPHLYEIEPWDYGNNYMSYMAFANDNRFSDKAIAEAVATAFDKAAAVCDDGATEPF